MSHYVKDLPSMVYGTAWKEDETEALTLLALQAGFRGIDTANQRRHYVEAAVGRAVTQFLSAADIPRGDLFLQTKFTSLNGQDHRLPYDPHANLDTQVQQSIQSSLAHLQTDYLDAYLLHGPSVAHGLTDADWTVWRAMEQAYADGKVRALGVSNVTDEQIELLWRGAAIKPQFVQNRCFANRGWDLRVRRFCTAHQITYQGFSLLTANPQIVTATQVRAIADRHGASVPQVIFRFAQQLGMLPLTGTTDTQHMRQDLDCDAFSLFEDDVQLIEHL